MVHSQIELAKGFLPTEQALLKHAIANGDVIDDGSGGETDSDSSRVAANARNPLPGDKAWVSSSDDDLDDEAAYETAPTPPSSGSDWIVSPRIEQKKKKKTKKRGDMLKRFIKNDDESSSEPSFSSDDESDSTIPEPVPPRPVYVEDIEQVPGPSNPDTREPPKQLDWELREDQPEVVQMLTKAGEFIFQSLLDEARASGAAQAEAKLKAAVEQARREERARCVAEHVGLLLEPHLTSLYTS